ncbi:hypothetical protein [Phyllobacterium sp. YR531]|uniref:hypothetical protein n=1 Tax=Phyllobacterium sp. YR531 TaxID=1144343 RepID=UPI00026FC43F|nr:hypothetical protein [Phyllobacterium sp. YR531]EJM97836.1 hypothetical protein PMI41_04966 [Phyllobacterium sp. YR531]
MSRISPINYDQASPEARAEHDLELKLRGRMTNMKRVLLHSPVAHRIYAEWFTLRDLLRPVVSDRAIWLFSLAISEANKSAVPITFFRRALIDSGIDPDAISPDGDEALLTAFAAAIVADSNAIPEGIWQKLKAVYSESTIVNLVAFAGIMIATTIFTNTMEIDLDPELNSYQKKNL